MYLEGSDQHRGWFHSSLLESCGTRGKAPFKSILSHGFVVDGKGMKMSKSMGNVISPEDILKNYGADILRVWASASDYAEDLRIDKNILIQHAESYRKIRNTFRFMLGNLKDNFEKQNFNVIKVVNELEQRLEDISDDIEVAIIGCYVNGPGESKAANIGLTGASPNNLLYVDGSPNKKIANTNLVDELEEQVRQKVAQSKIDAEKMKN